MKVSVVIPTYNRASLLVKAIESVLNQTYPVLEILVCDDGSTDNSKLLVSRFDYQIVKWIDCGKNGRPAIPRNIGIKEAKGDWIAFLDSDDEWLSNKLEYQIKAVKLSHSNLICTNAWAYNESNKRLFFENTINREIRFEELVRSNSIICSSVLCEKETLHRAFLFPEESELKALEDYILWLKVSMLTSVQYISEPLVMYLDVPAYSIRKESDDIIKQRAVIFDYFKRNKRKFAKSNLLKLYKEFKLQYKSRLYRLIDLERFLL